MYNNREYQSVNITSATTTNVFTGKGRLGTIVINDTGSLGTVTINDTGSPTVALGTIRLSGSAVAALQYDVAVSGGLQIITSGAPNLTVTYTRT